MLALKAENISKQYRLGQVGTGTLTHDLNRFWYKVRGKEDPYLKIGDDNNRSAKGSSEYVWSLRDINFEIEQGDAVGIVGRNGAGKSTLLKLLSKVTKPTTGTIYTNGRVASLLEVGTGFHPEMTGRENVYLNGAILGMTKKEIKRKFDEIVDFSGVERYIDTPVKRYSSGMYVRLAFAVAAHLESEILIVDEVLAVGDSEFQKKCLGKMGDVTKGEGRTILFVSHNMAAINALCNKGIVLEQGNVLYNGEISLATETYRNLNNLVENKNLQERTDRQGTGIVRLKSINIFSQNVIQNNIYTGQELTIRCEIENNIASDQSLPIRFDINVFDSNETYITQFSTFFQRDDFKINRRNTHIDIMIPKLNLLPGIYLFSAYIKVDNKEADWINNVMKVTVEDGDYFKVGRVMPKGFGLVALDHNISIK